MKKYNVAVVGATGAVGGEMLRVLRERRFPVKGLKLLASPRSKGRRIAHNGATYTVDALSGRSFAGIDVALFSAGAARSLEFGPEAVRRGAVVVDNSSAFRMAKDVPLIVPEVNPEALRRHRGLIANPNCSTIIMVVAVAPLHRVSPLKRLVAATYQAVSGAGTKAILQLYRETQRVMRQSRVADNEIRIKARLAGAPAGPLPKQIAFNVIPQVDVFLEGGGTKEELKVMNETRKILRVPDLPIASTCVRVPVFFAHSAAVWLELERALSPNEAREIFRHAPGVRLADQPARGAYPQPLDAGGLDAVLVGRIRKDPSVRHGLALWVSGDNLRKGAATNAVQIAELLIKRR